MRSGEALIIFIVPRYYPHVGGVEYVVKSVAERLAKMGFDVRVVAGETDIERPAEEEINGVRILRWPVYRPYGVPRRIAKLSKYLRGFSKGAAVVHLHNVHSVFPVAALLSLRPKRAKFVLTMHYHGSGHSALANTLWPMWRRLVKRVLRHVDVVHAVSSYEAELIRRHFGVEAVVIEHGVEEWLRELSWVPENYALYAGRIERYKDIERLGRVIGLLQREGLDLNLRVVGDGNHRRRLLSYLANIGVRFEWSSFLPYDKYIDVLRRATFLANLSKKEAFGMTINEAHAVGTPVVVTEPWGRHFANRPRTLIIGEHDDDRAVASKLIRFITSAKEQPRPVVLTWSEVTREYVYRLYS